VWQSRTKGMSLRAKGVAILVEGGAFRVSSQLKMGDTFILRGVTYLSELARVALLVEPLLAKKLPKMKERESLRDLIGCLFGL